MQPYHTEQRLNINPTYVISTPVWTGSGFKRSQAQLLNQRNLADNTHKGKLSNKSISKLRNSVNWLVESAQWKPLWWEQEKKFVYFKVNFITLTIPKQPTESGEVDGKLLMKMLNTFLSYSRKYFYLRNYVWKVERGKLGKLHIHMTTDTFIHWRELRTCWNRILDSNGLIDAFKAEFGHDDPNSTDVHAVNKISNLAGYLCKYMSKDTGLNETFKNRLWGCNNELTKKCQIIFGVDEMSDTMRPLMKREIEWKRITTKQDYMGRVRNVGEIFFMSRENWQRVGQCAVREAYNNHRWRIRNNTIQLPLEYSVIYEVNKQTGERINTQTVKPPEPDRFLLQNERGRKKQLNLFG